MHWPEPLRKGSRVALVAPARCVKAKDLQPFRDFCGQQGWEAVYESETLSGGDGFFAGRDKDRIKILQQFLDDERVKAIWVVRGGHGVSRVWPEIDWKGFRRYPKWLIGFSDATPLLWGAVYQGVVAVHGPVAVQIPHRVHPKALDRLLRLLQGEGVPPLSWEWRPWYAWREGIAQGHLLGGNLSLLSTLTGTSLDYRHFDRPALLFVEEVGEYYYRLDRLLWHLRNAGWFERPRGILVGALSDLMDDEDLPFSKSLREIVEDVTQKHPGPIAMGLPAGHVAENNPLPVGAWASLIVREKQALLIPETKS